MPERVLDFVAVLTALDAARVRFVLVGGLAMVAQGSAYITTDIDICYAPGPRHLAAIVIALQPLNPRLCDTSAGVLPLEKAAKIALNLALTTDLADIDLYGDTPGVASFEALWEYSVVLDLNGTAVHIASVNDLIAMKRVANRPKDQLQLLELEALRWLAPQAEAGE